MDEIIITRDELARDVRIWLRIARQKQPHLLRGLANLKDVRGYPDEKGEAAALFAFADFLADKMQVSGKRIVRERGRGMAGGVERTSEEDGIMPNGKVEDRR